MSKVFFSVTMSLDGFLAPRPPSNGGNPFHPSCDPAEKQEWLAQWSELQKYVFQQKFFRERLKLGEGGETGEDNRLMEETFARTGVSIMGKRMFDAGEYSWPEEAPFHTPVYVVTHTPRAPWQRIGTTFHFVNDGIHSALQQARAACGGKDIRIAGGANLIMQYLNAGLVDEFYIALSPVFFGTGIRLLDGVDRKRVAPQLVRAVNSPMVTHLHYTVKRL